MKNKTSLVVILDRKKMDHRARGFTLVEMALTLAVIGVLLAVGIPMLQNIVRGSQLVGQATKVTSAFTYARSEASSRAFPVVICASSDGNTCSGSTDWTSGWIIYSDLDGDSTVDTNEIFKKEVEMFGNVTLNSNVDRITFEYSGETTLLTAAAFHLCAENALDANVNDSKRSRIINVSMSGITNVRNGGATCT